MHDAQHPASELRGVAVQRNPVNGGNGVVIDRAEWRNQRRDAIRCASILIAPWTARMKSKYATGKSVGKVEFARLAQVPFTKSAAQIAAFIPDTTCRRNA